MLGLRFYGDPVLRRKCRPVREFDDKIRDLAREMTETMHASRGIGLAANQVGARERIIVIDPTAGEEEGETIVLVNPRLARLSDPYTDEEGCLSFPGLRLSVPRALEVRVEAVDLSGNPVAHEARGLLARALQHEMDHLNGVLFVDRLPWRTRLAMLFKLPKLKRQYRRRRTD
jgi:peptide deformylase